MVSLIVTIRGIQRPLGPNWTRPYFPILTPLDPTSAKTAFLAISDLSSDDPDVDTLLDITSHLPLPLTLMAHLAQYEPPSFLLERFADEGTSMLKSGSNRATNMDLSIELSLSSVRATECSDAISILRLIASLKDGILRSQLGSVSTLAGIPSLQKSISNLCQSSLLLDEEGRLRVPPLIKAYLSHHNDGQDRKR